MNSVSQLFQEIDDFGEIVFYAILMAILVIGVVFGRFIVRGLVNRRVKGIQTEGLDLGDLTSMSDKGLLTEEEMKIVRRKFAEQQLAGTKEESTQAKPMDLLLAIEADPSRATSLLPESSEHTKRALEGMKKKEGPRSVEEQLREQLGAASPDAAPPPLAPSTPPVPVEQPKASQTPGQPPQLASSSASPQTASPAPTANTPTGGSSQGMDLDSMLAKGLISKREYDLLMARVKKAGG